MRFTVYSLQAVYSLLAVLLSSGTLLAENWPRFRGPNGQGISTETGLPLTWNSDQNVAWKTAIPGEDAWSSPIVYDNYVFLTSVSDEGKSCFVVGIDRSNGKIIWNTKVHQQETSRMRRQNSYATPTPVTDGERVYAVFFDGTAVALDLKGNIVWKNSDISYYSLHGLGASPILAGDHLVMPFDGSSRDDERVGWKIPWENAVLLAIDKRSGMTSWKGKRGPSRVGHVTPIVDSDNGQIISAGGDKVQGFDVGTGKRVWSIYSQGEGVTPSPILVDDLIITSSGFEEPTIRAIRTGGNGDVTTTHIAWEQKQGVPVLASPLFVAPYLYTITRDNILHCIQASDGRVVWKERLQGVHSASPVYADGRIYILSEDGVTVVLKPGPAYEELARNEIGEVCKASMAVSEGQFFIRSAKHLYCIAE